MEELRVRLSQEAIDVFQHMRGHPNTVFEVLGGSTAPFRELCEKGIAEEHPEVRGCYLLSNAGRGIVTIEIGD
jgi:hypothetical protein